MKGSIYTRQKCFLCQKDGQKGTLKYNDDRGILQCPIHSEITWAGACEVRFGREHTKRFKTVKEAERHLNYIRVQTDEGRFDQREWAKDQPLSFLTLREKYTDIKDQEDLSSHQKRLIKRVLSKAGVLWDHMQIADIGEGEIEDFLTDQSHLSKKTLSNYKSALHSFWAWVVRREKRKSGLSMPEFPTVNFKMKMRTIVSVEDQQEIIDKVQEMTWAINPRIWLAIKLLSVYPRVRPGEMLNVKEGHINLSDSWIVFPQPKEREPKFIHLVPEICDLIKEIKSMAPAAMPDVYFFRHIKSRSGVQAGTQFGPKYLNKWWKRACAELGIEGVPVYPGTKHSTTTALGQHMTPEQIKSNVTGHTSQAFQRYYLPDHDAAVQATRKVLGMQGAKHPLNISGLLKKTN